MYTDLKVSPKRRGCMSEELTETIAEAEGLVESVLPDFGWAT